MGTFTPDLWRSANSAADLAPLPAWPSRDSLPSPTRRAADPQASPLCIDLTPVERILRTTRSVALGRYHCPPEHPQFRLGGGPHTCSYITFHRTSVKLQIGTWRPEVATPNHVSFYNVGQSYSREAIGIEGDESDWIAISPALLRELSTPLACAAGSDETLFPRPFAPVSPAAFFAQRELFAAAGDANAALNSLRLEEAVVGLVGTVVGDACEFWGLRGKAPRKPRPLCHRRRLQIVEDAKALLARDYCSDLSLSELARRVHCSAAHLSRMFHAATGYRLCAYRQELRLRKGLFLLEDSGLEVGEIALQVGFASHSHFTSAFHRRFGVNPSAFVKWTARRRRQTMTS